MAVSPRRVSKSRKGMKNSHSGITPSSPVIMCSKCSEFVKLHRVCKCGYYRKKKVL